MQNKDKFELLLDKYFEKPFFQSRYSILLVVISSLLAAITLFILGSYEILIPVIKLFQHHSVDKVELDIIKSVDLLLFGLVMMIFSFGVYDLFISELDPAKIEGIRPNWMKYKSVDDLKSQLTKVIVIILVIDFFQLVTENIEHMDYNYLVIPVGIVLIAYALRLMHIPKE